MNSRSFKTVFSKRLGCLVAVGEHAASQGKANGAGQAGGAGAGLVLFVGLLAAGFASVSLAWAQPASNALPTGGVVAQGAASVSTSGAVMSIQQSTAKAVLNWQSFDIGSAARVNIVQPGADAVMLNRVTGANPSQIFGQLSANGQVVLVNPNGVLFGKDGSVSASSFTASTLGISDTNFMAGNLQFERNGSTAAVVNQGSIKATGGYVALLGASVSNEGRIETNGGAALLGAAETVKVPLGSSGRIKLELTPSAINAAVTNSKDGTIVTHGGQVYMQAAALNTAVASILQSGSIDTTGEQGGAVHVLADGGQIKVDGSITANSTGKDKHNQPRRGGDIFIGRDEDTNVLAAVGDASGARLESQGGFVETSGQFLKVDGAQVKAKDWLLDPYNITIGSSTSGTTYSDPSSGDYTYTPSATSSILASDIQSSLNNGTNVKISTGLSGSAGSDAGNITVASNITKSSGTAAMLTLEANNNITINSGVRISDSGMTTRNLAVKLTANSASGTSTSSALLLASNAAIDVGGSVNIDVAKSVGGGIGGAAIYLSLGTLNAAENNAGSRTLIRGGTVNVSMALSGTNTFGLFGQHAAGIEATNGDLSITATYTGSGSTSGNGIWMGSGWNSSYAPASSILKSTNGKVTAQSVVSGTSADGGLVFSGTALSATNDIQLKAQITDSTKTAISISNEFNNPKINSSAGNVLIQSNSGSVRMSSLTAAAITGGNITIDNTGSSLIRDANGNYSKGSGIYTGTSGSSIQLSGSGTGVQASGNLDIIGVGSASGGNGVVQTGTSISGGRVSVQGENLGTGSGSTNGFYNTGAITSTTGDLYIRGTSQKDNALSVQGAVTGKTNVTLIAQAGDASNTASSWGLYLNKAVTSQTGDVSITASTTNGSLVSANLVSGASLVTSASGKSITVNADTLSLDTAGASINAGSSGKVYIRPKTSGLAIDVGGNDVLTSGSNVLGLSNAELNRVTAGELNIGSTSSGNITLTSAVTTVDAAGHVALITGGNLAVNANLQTGSTGSKNLMLQLSGSGSATQTAALNTSSLALDGALADYTLTNAGNVLGTLAAAVKSVSIYDANALTIGTVGSLSGITTDGVANVISASTVSGAGNIFTNGYAVTFNTASGTGTYSGTISGSGKFVKAGSGTTVFSSNQTYTGGTDITGGTLRIGSGGSTGSLSSGAVTLANNANLVFDRSDSLAITNNISGSGNLYISTGGGASFNNLGLTGSIQATAAGDIDLLNTGNVVFGAATTANNGNINFQNSGGTLTIGSVNGVSGVTAHGSGDVTLVGNQTGVSGNGLSISNNVTSASGDITLTGTTAANNRPGDAFAGVRNGATVSGANITVTATATDPTADVLGYYGGAGSLLASGTLSATGTSAGAGVGFYMWSGATRAGAGMTISGTSNTGPGVSLTNNAQIRNTTSGPIAIAGSTNNTATQVAVGLYAASVINDQGAVSVTSGNGSIKASSGTNALSAHGAIDVTVGNASATNSDGIDASTLTITQSANANVTLTTSGTGDLTAPKVVNNGSGNVVLGAGISHQTAAGGNVRTVAGNTVTQAAAGKTYVYSGSLSGTGSLSALDTSFGSLYYQGASHVLNTAFGQTYGATITGGADAQVLFRQALDPSYGFALDLSGITLSKTYGQSDPVIPTAVVAAYAGPATLTTSVSGAGGGSNALALTAADALATLAGTRTAGEDASSTPYAYTLTAGLGTTVSVQPSLQINRANLSAVLVGSVTKMYDGTDWATGLTSANFNVTGWVGSEGATVGQTVGNYANANVAANTGSGTVTATLEASHFTATGSTRLSNYILPTSAAGNVGTITRAPLTVKVNDTAMFVTQNPNTATDHGFSVTGLRNGETAANVLGPLSRTYTGAANPNAGLYTNVYELVAVPSPANYNLTVEKGSLRVAAADKLLITLSSHSETYGVLTTVNAGPTAGQPVAQYCLVSTNCNGANIVNLTMTDLGGGQWKATDPNNAWVSFSTAVDAANANSRGGYLNAGNYRYNIAGFSTGNTVNFAGTELSAGVLTITPKTLGLTATNVSKVYDGTTSVAGVGLIPTGALAGDDVLVAPAGGSFNSKAVGSQGFSLTGLQLQGQDSANYAFSAGTFTGTGTITPRLLSLSALVPDKVYDGTSQAGLSGLSLSGVVAGDVVTVSGGSASFADRYVARDASGQVLAKSVAVNGALLGGADAGNYQLDGSVAASARILPLTVSAGIVAKDKVYDGTAEAQFQGLITGVLAGDAVTLSADSSRFASRHVQRDSAGHPAAQGVLATGLRLSGTDAGNYSLSSTSAAGSATITPKLLQASAAVADKMYDGTRVAALSGLGGAGIVAGDAAVVEAESATFAGKDVLRDAAGQVLAQTVTVAGLKVSGADAGNYALSATDFTATARITPRTLSVVGTRVADKMQDGTTRASVTLGVLTGLVGQEKLLTSAQGSFRSASVGLNKPVDVVYSLQDGGWGGMAANYELPSQVLQATIFAPNSVVPVQPVITPTSPSGGSRVVMAPAMPAVATTAEVPDQGMCSSLLNDQCRCSETALEDVEVCVLPREGSLASEAVSRNP